MSNEVRALEPKEIWENFADLNAVPRPSKKEERVIQFMVDFGNKLGLKTETDKVGNIIIKKPATEGMEDRQTVILQSHVDMVHQKNNATDFDFDKEGIKMIVDGDWVKADGTTLGADNGIGVAAIMGLLASSDIPHPALEAMFTVDEETGMTGAKELDPSFYEGTILLNLDTEDDDEISIGCAGGIDTNTTYEYEEVDSISDVTTYIVELKGLMGGHSGMDIDKGRGNANKMMARLLIESPVELILHDMNGGGLRNAIPREAKATVSVAHSVTSKFEDYVASMAAVFATEYSPVETKIDLSVSKTETPAKMLANHDKNAILAALNAVFNGVFKMSLNFDNLVETSSSLAQVIIKDGTFESKSLQRSSVETTKDDVARTIRSVFDLLGADVEQSGDYPGWEPNPDSSILKTMREMYEKRFNEKPNVMACHAGLECGILGTHLPNVDMISFGPNIRHAHSPDECCQISSVQKFWGFLLEVLKETPKKTA
ncbi:aminoacyl-histidine dipeptidase [Brumimicrobium oceani]|uniref:Cytosol non-specific dipeptidase n=1 Tax=Brumimicrobium oceani TaxID=2100725 RepID=A0A2U2XG57_9FLAO|nr:aminoacyl-histidine dipeptidase [Brumimicrobium oceani]PWH86776.1 cytosol nonspecific dipeptidase [Brumimicrobium oceani]